MRIVKNINDNWFFTKELKFPQDYVSSNMESINLPHTYNAKDGQGEDSYYRGEVAYLKTLGKIDLKEDEEVYIEFNGVNMSMRGFLNNHFIGSHDGGYSKFRFNVTKYLNDENILVVFVNNCESREVYPQRADFTFYGGIYRDVNLIKVNKSHFELDYFGGNGVKITPDSKGLVEVEGYFKNAEGKKATFTILNREEEVVSIAKSIVEGNKATAKIKVEKTRLWNGLVDPYLYTLKASIDTDEVVDRFGFRSFEIDVDRGFILNGKEYPLIGVSRHQDREGVGSALTKEMHREDMDLIREMGATTVRLAHYQHDDFIYSLADEYGFIIWAEIPYISAHMEGGNDNTVSQLKELIIQNYNHPSIVVWGLSNEITVTGYTEKIYENHVRLNDLAHRLDPTRKTTIANLFLLETSSPLVTLPDLRSYNLYNGWYTGEMDGNEKFLDSFHEKYPTLPIGLSEYGADANVKYQSENPTKGDYTESYQALYHEHMLKMRESRPYIWAMHVWNMFDFAAFGRKEGGKKGINQKGLVTFDRKIKKDAFYIYKAYLSKEPFVHICGRRFINRTGDETIVKVYSNLDKVSLYVDGELLEEKCGDKVFNFSVKINKKHHIKAISSNYYDEITIQKVDEEDKSYICETKMKVNNWFEESVIDSSCFSIKDKVKDIKANEEANKIYTQFMAKAMESFGDIAKSAYIPKEMQERLDNMTLEENLKMAAHLCKPEMIKEINALLQGVKK